MMIHKLQHKDNIYNSKTYLILKLAMAFFLLFALQVYFEANASTSTISISTLWCFYFCFMKRSKNLFHHCSAKSKREVWSIMEHKQG